MEKSLILKSQKEKVFNDIRVYGFDPSDYTWEEVKSIFEDLIVSKIIHKKSGYYFVFDFYRDSHNFRLSPGNMKQEESVFVNIGNWDVFSQYFFKWLSYLDRELEAVDFWELPSNENNYFQNQITESQNNLFSSEEVKRIGDSIKNIKNFLIEELRLDSTQLTIANEKLDYLVESSKRMGKKDWLILSIGAIVNLIYVLALTPENSRDLLKAASKFLSWLVSNNPLLNL
ncbi:MAG: hypothetical protein ABI550_00655 [Ignavibacteriaceae bacterium]